MSLQRSLFNLARRTAPTMFRQAHTAVTKPAAELSTEFANRHITPGIGRIANDLIIERGKGSWVWTTDGKKWLDFTSGIGVTCLGEPAFIVVEHGKRY